MGVISVYFHEILNFKKMKNKMTKEQVWKLPFHNVFDCYIESAENISLY